MRLGAGELVEPAEHPQVLATREILVDRRVLAREADQRADPVGLLDDVEAGDARAPAIRLEQGGEDPYRRRLAGAVGPEQAEDRAFLDGQVHAVEGADLMLPGAVDLDEALRVDREGHAIEPFVAAEGLDGDGLGGVASIRLVLTGASRRGWPARRARLGASSLPPRNP